MRRKSNPGKEYHLNKCWEHAEKGSRKGISLHMANWQAAQLSSEIEAARKSGATQAEIDEAVRTKNPGTNWHIRRADELRAERHRYTRVGGSQWDRLNERVLENELAADASRRLGMNPRKKNPWYMGAEASKHYPIGTRVKAVEGDRKIGVEKGMKGIVTREVGESGFRGYMVDTPSGTKFFHFSIARPIGQRTDNPRRKRNPDKGLLGTLVFCTAVVLGIAWLGKRVSG